MKQKNNVLQYCRLIVILLLVMLSGGLHAQEGNGTVRGRVYDAASPLIGASVLVEGSKEGTTTDSEGNYRISLPAGTYTLSASYIGFGKSDVKNVRVTAGQETVVNFSIKANTELQEVVVSYGKQKQREVTGSIAQVNADDLQDMPVGQFAQQLQGKVAGVQILQSSGQPGRGVDFRIRGAASMRSSTQPLFVIDGLPITGSINNINPAEIETFTVLKDASATALYGSRAANGVILITTKHAKPGDSKIEFNSYYGIQKIAEKRVPKPMNGQQFAQFMKQRFEDRAKYEGYTGGVPADYQNPEQYGEGTDWYNLLTQTAPIQSYDVSIQSAREKSASTVIAGYQEQEGVLINTGTKLFSLRLNQDLSLNNNKIKIGFNLAPSYRIDHNNRIATDGVSGLWGRLFEGSPIISPFKPDGTYNQSVASPGMVAYINPLAIFKENTDDYYTTRILGNAFFNYEFLPGLSLKTNLAGDKGVETRKQFTTAVTTSNSISTGASSSIDNYSWTAETNLEYAKTFGNDHNIQALIGYSAQRFDGYNNSIAGTGFPSDDIQYLSAATSISAASSTDNKYSLLSKIARLSYNYKGKYLLQGAIREDGSSRFGENKKFGYFPSVSAGWLVSDEPFMEQFKFLDLFKIRASYGITGNNFFGDFDALSRIGKIDYTLNGSLAAGLNINSLGNSELSWERNKQLDIGLDLELLNNRISFTYDYYHKISDGLIQSRPIPQASGFGSILFNIGEFEFWGHEFSVNTTNLTGNLNWNTSFNVSIDRNMVNDLVNPGFIRRSTSVSSDYYRLQEGHRLGEFYGFVFLGLYKDALDLASSAKYGSASDVGTIKVKDVNGDGVIDDVNDRTFIGDPTPDFTFGLSNDFRYRNFDLNISMAGSVGGQILAGGKWAYQTNMDGSRVPLAAALDYWRSPENPGSGIYPRTKTNTTAMGRQVNSQWLEDGTYLSAKNISLGYTFGLKDNLSLKRLRIFASVQQAFILTKYSGINPEINLAGQDATRGIGVDENAYPIPRTFSLGILTTFK